MGVRPFGYLTSMVVTIALWLTLAPAIGAVAGARQEEGQREPLARPSPGTAGRAPLGAPLGRPWAGALGGGGGGWPWAGGLPPGRALARAMPTRLHSSAP